MLDAKWMLLLGLPIIAILLALAWRRTRALVLRIREVREEMARNPQDPYLALATLMDEKKAKKTHREILMAKGLTDRQQEVFNFIVSYIEEKGYPPTIREMQLGLTIGSLRGVTIHLDALQKKGYIERQSSKNGPRHARGIQILAHLEPRSLDEIAGLRRLPLIGTIAAGTPPVWRTKTSRISSPSPINFSEQAPRTASCCGSRARV